MPIDVTLLGTLRVNANGTDLPKIPAQPMRAALLAYLVTEREAGRQTLITEFQKRGEDPEKTRHRLNQTLHVLRGDLTAAAGDEGKTWVASRGETMIVSGHVRTDVQAFKSAIAVGDHEQAIATYGGEFLAGRDSLRDTPNYEPWVSRVRDRLRRDHQSVSLGLIERSSQSGNLDRAIQIARRWVELDPLDDRGQDQLIRLLVAAGRRPEALQAYFAYEESVWRAFGDAPWEETRELIESLDAQPTTVVQLRQREEAESKALGTAPNSVVVSWFGMSEDDPEAGPRSAGLVRRVQDALSRVGDLAVLPMSATMYLKDNPSPLDSLGERLNVAWVIDGTVTLAGERLKADTTLVRTRDGKRWKSTFASKSAEDEYRIHREIAHWVSSTVTGAIEGEGEIAAAERRARKARAMSLFDVAYTGYEDRSKEGLELAVAKFEEALQIEPNFARALAKLADALIAQSQFGYRRPRDVMPRALEAANRALEIEPDSWEAHSARGHYRDTYAWDWDGAEADYLAAIQLNPDDFNARTWYADLLTAIGRGRESRVQMRRAEEAHPLSPAVQWSKGAQHYRAGRHSQAIDSFDRALALKPGYAIALVFRAFAHTGRGEPEVAIRDMQAVRQSVPHPIPIVELAFGVAQATVGNVEAGREALGRIRAVGQVAYVPAVIRAILLGQLGELDAAFAELELAMEERWGQLIYLAVEPVYEPLRRDPRCLGFLERLALSRPA
jgi:DNA-binding SARP family transcriptional activator/Flp pilus assembly protein TadD